MFRARQFVINTRLWGVFAAALLISAPAHAQSPKTPAAFKNELAGIAGLDKLELGSVKSHGDWAETTATLRGEAISLVAFKPAGAAKSYIAVLPKAFKLASYLPISNGTPIDGVSFKDMAFVVVPKGAAKSGVATATLPAPVRAAVSHLGNTVDLKDGLSLFGEADFQSAGAIKTLLQTVGHRNMTLPLTGALPTGLFGVDMKTASGAIKDTILKSLDLQSPLPRLRIPGMPSMVSVTDARLAIISQKKGGEYEVVSGVTGTLDLNFAGKKHDFGFNVMAIRGGHADQLKLNASTADKISLKLIHPLELDDLKVLAAHKGGKWNIALSATTKFKNKTAAVTLTQTGKGEDIAVLDTKLKLSDMLPSGISVPGLTDVTFTKVALFPDYLEVRGTIKGMEMAVVALKHGGQNYIATTVLDTFEIGNLIPGVKGTPLDDAKFVDMVLIWAPKSGAAKGLKPAVFTPDIEAPIAGLVKSVDLKPGINVIGEMVIAKGSKIGKLLSSVHAYKRTIPLIGNLSPKIFHPGSAADIKNDILDHLDIKIALPELDIPGVKKLATFRHAELAIKGIKDGAKRTLDVTVGGELDIKAAGKTLAFDYAVEVVKKPGKPDEFHIKGETEPGTTLSLPLVNQFKLTKLDFVMNQVRGNWVWQINGETTFRSKTVNAHYQSNKSLLLDMNMSLAEISGHADLPVLKDIKSNWIVAMKNLLRVDMNVKGVRVDMDIYKPRGESKFFVGFAMGNASPAKFIPGADRTPLKDVTFERMVFIHNPTQAAKTFQATDMPDEVGYNLQGDGKSITLKPGLNIFGHMDVHPTGAMATMLKHAGIHELKLPLNGTIDPKALSKNISAAKDAILDNLDIKATLPLPHALKIPSHVKLSPPGLEIKGIKKDGRREVDVAVAGEMDVEVQNQKVAFFYKVETKKQAGKPAQVVITGDTAPGKKITVEMGHRFTLDSLSLLMEKTSKGWSSKVSAKSEFRSKPIDVSYEHESFDGKNILVVHTELTLAEIVGQASLPGLDDIKITTIQVHDKFWRLIVGFKGTYGYINVFKPEGASKRLIAVTVGPPTISPAEFIPGTANTPLKDVDFKGLAFVYAPQGTAGRLYRNQMPRDIGYRLRPQAVPGDIVLKSGLNVFGKMEFHPAGELATLLKHVGIHDLSLPLNGGFSPKVFAKNISGSAIKNEILDHLDLKIPLPKLNLPGASTHASIRHTTLTIKGINKGGQRSLDVNVGGELDVHIAGKQQAFDFDVEVQKPRGKPAYIQFNAAEEKGKTLELGLFHKFTLSNVKFDMNNSERKWIWYVTGDSKLHGKPVSVAYNPGSGGYLEISTKMTLAEIVGENSLPGLDKVDVDWVTVQKGKVEIAMKVKGVDSKVIMFKPSGAEKSLMALLTGNFSPATFIPGTQGTPLKDVEFNGLGFIYNRNTQPLRVDASAAPDVSAWLKRHDNVSNPTVKKGLNVFGKLDVHPTGELATLLKHVGVHDLSLPLNGSLSPKVFAKNISGSAIKNEILDHLDIKVPLAKLALPGISKIATIRNTTLAIKGVKKGDTREVDVNLGGELDIEVGSKQIAIDFDVEVKGAAGARYVEVYAYEEPGKTIKVDFMSGFTLSNIFFEMDNSQGHWVSTINARAKLGSKDVRVAYINNPAYGRYMNVFGKVTLADAIDSPGLPGLDDVEFDSLEIVSDRLTAGMKVKGISSQLSVFKQPGSAKHFISWVPTAQGGKPAPINPASFIPGAANTPLKDVSFHNMAFVYNPYSFYFQLHTGTLPSGVEQPIKRAHVNMSVGPGLNVFGDMVIHPTGEMASLLKDVGVHDLTLPLNGGFSPKAFAKNHSAGAIKNAILDKLDVKVKLPTPHIPEISKFVTFKKGHLEVRGKTPDGQSGIDVGVSGDVDVHVKSEKVGFFIDVEYDKAQGGGSDLHITGHTDAPWNHPMGIKFLDLESLKLNIKKKKKASGASTFDIKMTAKSDIGSHSKLDVKVDVHEKNGSVTDAFFELDGPLKMSDIPGVKDVPNSSHFTLDTLKISEHGIEAKTSFGGKSDLDVYLFTGSGWNLIIRQDNFTMTELVPPLKDTPLKHIVLSEAAVVLSKDGLTGPLSGFSVIAQDALKDVYGANAANIDVESGLSLIAAFEHKKSKGGLSDAFSRLGLSEERVILMGDIGGIFGGPTKLDVEVDLSAHTGAKSQPKWMKSKPGVEAVFSMVATEADGAFDVEFGIGVDITADVHGTELVFDAKTALEFEDEKIDVKIVADLKDKAGWKKPFGIPGFTLFDVGLDLGIDEDGAIHLGFDGNIEVSGDKYSIAADADLLPEALGAPQDIAFKATADKVDMFFMEAIAIEMIGGDFSLQIPKGILPTFTDVKFAFVTPGAADPDLNITGEGFAMAGAMNWLDHELGSMDVSVSPTKGITASGKIDNMKLGPLELKNNDFGIKAAPTGIPSLKVDSDIVLLGVAKERFHIKFDKTGVDMKGHFGAGSAADITAELKLSGLDLSVKKPDFKKADFFIAGDIQLDVQTFIAGPAQAALNDIFNALDAAFKAGKKAVKSAEAKVDTLTGKINAERAKVRREKAAAEGRLRNAENRVNAIQGRINYLWGRYHHCHGWHKWPCRIREGIQIGWAEGEKRGADWALDVARSLISHFPIDLDPAVAALIVSRDTAREALRLALVTIEGADALDGFMKKATAKLTQAISKAADIDIKKAAFKGDIQGIIKHDEPVDLAIDIVLFGAEIKDQFAFRIKKIGEDLAGDVEHLAMLGLHALDHLIESGVGDIPGPLKSKLKGHVASKMDAAGAAHKRELAKFKKKFAGYNKTATAIRARNAAYNTAYLQSQMEKKGDSPLDRDVSQPFNQDLIEAGHTGLCLTNVGGVIEQYSCMNHADQKWATRVVTGAPRTKPNSGYVQIYQPSGGLCIVPAGSWGTAQRAFKDPKATTEGSFDFPEPVFQGNGVISVRKCVNSKEYYWKAIKHGDGWLQLANLATNSCLNFKNNSSHPGVAKAGWTACVGSANQVFRVADSASPKFYKADIALRNDAQSACFSDPDAKGQISMVNCASAARYNYGIDIRGYVRFVNRKTGKCLQPASYADGANLIERACSQLDYQWWNTFAVPGGWRIINAQTKKCTFSPSLNSIAVMETCANTSKMIIAPIVDPTSGVTMVGKSPSARPAHPKPVYAGTPANIGICAMNGMIGQSWVTGTLADDGKCWVALDGKSYDNKGSQQYLSAFDGAVWTAGGKGTLPTYAIPTGFTDGVGKPGLKTAYTCRAKFKGSHNGNRELTGFGWTTDGATCHYDYWGAKKATVFQILTRLPSKSYNLTLNGFWPVPKAGVWYPGLDHVLASELKHKEVQKVVKVVVKAVAHEAEKAVRKVLPKIFHHHHHHHHWW